MTGFQPLQQKAVEHESDLERDFVTLTTFVDAGTVVTSQPVTIYFDNGGARRRYTPDFLVEWTDGRRTLACGLLVADLAGVLDAHTPVSAP